MIKLSELLGIARANQKKREPKAETQTPKPKRRRKRRKGEPVLVRIPEKIRRRLTRGRL